jgi:hypothetical protein
MSIIAETKKESIGEFRTSQAVRLADVFVFAPALFYAGLNQELHPVMRSFLLISAGWVAVMNGKNYLANAETQKTVGEEKTEIEETQKTDLVRMYNIFVFSPIVIYAGTHKSFSSFMKTAMISMGMASIIYNGYYLTSKK